MRLLLINPNTNAATTAMMLAIARETAGAAATIDGLTATCGAPVILDEAALAIGAAEVARMTAALPDPVPAGIIIAAFGDPGLAAARSRLRIPIVGIAEAAVADASRGGRRFAIVTTTPALDRTIRDKVTECGADTAFAGIRYTRSGSDGMADPDRLYDELLEVCAQAVRHDGAAAIIAGGGPLASAARRLRHVVDAELIEPIPAATRALLRPLGDPCPTL